jgi:hypothetical protein
MSEVVWIGASMQRGVFVAEKVDYLIGSAFSPDSAKDKEVLKTPSPTWPKEPGGIRPSGRPPVKKGPLAPEKPFPVR